MQILRSIAGVATPRFMITAIAALMSVEMTLSVKAIEIPMHILVTINETPCLVNAGKSENIEFNNVTLEDIEKGTVSRPLPFVIDCGVSAPPEVKLWIQSQGSNTDSSLLSTSLSGLDIAIEDEKGARFGPNINHVISSVSPPAFRAVLIADSVSPPAEGDFTASATFQVSYN